MKIIFFANTEWYLYNFRLALARELASRGVEVVMVSPPGPYGERLQKAGFRWIPLAMDRRGLNPLRELLIVLALCRIYRRERPDLAHHFTIKPVIYGTIAARIAGIPAAVNAVAGLGYVFTSTALLANLLRPIVRGMLRMVLNGGSIRVVVQNRDDQAELLSYRLVNMSSMRLIRGSGVNTDVFIPRVKAAAGPLRVLLATRLLWDKGVKEFVEAAQTVRSSGQLAEFILAGAPDPGNPSSVPEEQLAQWQRLGLVRVLGHVDDMRELLGRVDVVVLPSYREGVPRILIEAASSGLPIVATDVPGCREIVEHGHNGLLVPARSTAELASAIGLLLADQELRARMGRAGRDKVLGEFDERLVINRTIEVYEEICPGKSLSLQHASLSPGTRVQHIGNA